MANALMLGDGVARGANTKRKMNTSNATGATISTTMNKTSKPAGAQIRTTTTGSTSGGGGGGYSSAPITNTVAPAATTAPVDPAPTPPPVSDDDWLAGDSTYQAALAALKKTLSGYQTQYDTSKTNYDTDYNSSLKNLGWNQDGNAWNADDTNTAYGRSYGNQMNDFAARDMLQSSFYGEALNNLLRQFNDQKGDLSTSRGRYMTDLGNTLTQQQNENALSQQQARAESIARKAAGISSMVG
jgi:hypothetical protein